MVWVGCVVCGWCCVLVVFCMACSSHHFVHTKPPPLSPFPLPLPPHSSVSVSVEKGVDHKVDGVEWSVVCGMQHISHCAFIKPSPTPVCLSSFTIPFSLSNSFSSSFLVGLVCLDRKSEGQVWDSPCQTHCAPHPIHTTLFPSIHAPLFSMSTWLIGL